MKYLITGGAGFIGSHIVDRLIDMGDVTVYDNLSSGRMEFIEHHVDKENFTFVEADVLDKTVLIKTMKGIDFVYHIASNPDIRHGTANPDYDLQQGTIATFNVLDAMRLCNVKNIVFSSSQTVYGDPTMMPIPENYGPLIPISLYGASKIACEGLITAFSHSFEMRSWIFRFANIIGKRATHGVINDFIEKLKSNPKELEILGDGKQSKSYLLVEEVVDSILYAVEHSQDNVNLYNLGCEDWIPVTRIAEIVVDDLGLEDVTFKYTGGERGWVGDIPKMMLSIEKLKDLGWNIKHNSEEAVKIAVKVTADALWRNQS